MNNVVRINFSSKLKNSASEICYYSCTNSCSSYLKNIMQNKLTNTIPKSIAVLPFVNMSGDSDNEYFSDGITEEIINALTSINGLKVTARTSSFAFKNNHIDIRTIGKQLGVATILEGSVRKSKEKIRITIQLIRTDDGFHLWSQKFDRKLEDIFVVQDEISLLIAEKIRENFGHFDIQDHLVEETTNSIDAYRLYLKGRFYQLKWNKKDLLTAVDYYKQSISFDSSFANPYFGIGLVMGILASWDFVPYKSGIKTAEEYLITGLKKDNNNYLGYFARGTISFWGKWEFNRGQQFFLKAMDLNPYFTDIEEGLAELYTALGIFDKAMEHVNNILRLNPLSPNHYYTKANIFYLSGNFEYAIEALQTALKIDQEFSLAVEMIIESYIQLNDYEKLENFLALHPNAEQPNKSKLLFRLFHSKNKKELDLIKEKIQNYTMNNASLIPWDLYIKIHMGNHDAALDILENGILTKKGQFINFSNDPFLKPLHKYKRFKSLVESVFGTVQLTNESLDISNSSTIVRDILSKTEIEEYLKAIYDLLEKEKIFFDPSLSLKKMAENLSIHPNKLSWLINVQIGKNFNEFINSYRIAEFKQKAIDPNNSNLTILGLAYECGFNSKTVFNSQFKKSTGMTPKEWLKSILH